jgi:predicted DNA-binding protein YlxM (UPF0122 family)
VLQRNSSLSGVSAPIKVTDNLSVSEFADLFGFPASAVVAAIEHHRSTLKKPFYSIPDLARRWNCSRATVYHVLREAEFKLFDMTRKGKRKGHWNVPATVAEQIEQTRMRALPETGVAA